MTAPTRPPFTPVRRASATATTVAAALLLAACASGGGHNETLEQARAQVNQVAAQPDVVQRAALELKTANDTLARADHVWRSDGDRAETEHLAYLATQQARTAEALGQARANEAKLNDTRGQADQLRLQARTREADAARQQAEAARADAASARAQADALQAKLKELEAQQTERGLLVTLGDVLFAFNSDRLLPTAGPRLDKLARFLADHPDRLLRVEGYTDGVGSDAYNLNLSQRRAAAVQQALVQRGVAAQRITTAGYGKAHPVASNATAEGRALNRRVEVIIADDQGVLRGR
ncbi:MAG: OmpA family protein [Pseudomonadota bacterium]|nr:OmpA family protein [Pseudomonadota bacterium]